MVNALSDVDGSILDCRKSIEEFDNELLSLHTEIFNRIQEQFSNLGSEISNIIELFDEFDVSDDKGIWSREGTAQLGLLTQQYELAQYRVQQYSNEINELDEQYLAGRYSATEYADKLAELSLEQWEAVKSAESAKDSIMDLNEARVENAVEGIEKETDAYKKLIDAQIEALRASKDLHGYEKSIAEKTKSITDLERQLAAMANDDSAAAVAKRKKLEEQLAEAKADLEEAEYEHSIEIQEEALNKQYENYEKEQNDEIDALRGSLNDRETIIAESFETVKNNAGIIGQEIAAIAAGHGITVSNALISSWQSGEDAVARYGETLSANTSAFICNIMGVENEVWNLQAQADAAADTLAWMFSTKADTLVNELETSYYAESNLKAVTQALQDTLVDTLERGYDVSSIVNSLNSVASAANSAQSAVSGITGASSGSTSVVKPPASTPSTAKAPAAAPLPGTNRSTASTSSSNTSRAASSASRPAAPTVSYGGGGIVRLDEKPRSELSYRAYAGGTRSSKGNIFKSDEKGYELKLPKLSSGKYTIANEGTQVFTKEQTDNLFELSKINPDSFIPLRALDIDMMQKLWNKASVLEPVADRKVDNNPSVNVHYDSMINVQGSLNSTDVKQMEAIVDKGINKLVNKMYDGIKYRRY